MRFNYIILSIVFLSGVLVLGTLDSASATTGKLTVTSDTTLTENHSGWILIGVNDVTLDCNGFTVSGASPAHGILITNNDGVSGVTVKNCIVQNFPSVGIAVRGSNSMILDNTVSGNQHGIAIDGLGVSGNTVRGNVVTNNANSGISVSNTSFSNTIEGNTVTDNGNHGISVINNSNDNLIKGNTIERNVVGGVHVQQSTTNTIDDNIIKENRNGVSFQTSVDNTVKNNSIIQNTQQGFFAGSNSPNNLIFHNNFIDNVNFQARQLSPNIWFDQSLLEGNFWSDYPGVDDGSGTGKHSILGDCIGDSDIPWPSSDKDSYPFINADGWLQDNCAPIITLLGSNPATVAARTYWMDG